MGPRRPQPASHHRAIPTLGALIAFGAHLAGCHDPACADSRAHELDAHGRLAVDDARRAQLGAAAREIALATGVIEHPPTPVTAQTQTTPIDIQAPQPGAALPVTVIPPTPRVDPRPTQGEAVPVGLAPPDGSRIGRHRRRH